MIIFLPGQNFVLVFWRNFMYKLIEINIFGKIDNHQPIIFCSKPVLISGKGTANYWINCYEGILLLRNVADSGWYSFSASRR